MQSGVPRRTSATPALTSPRICDAVAQESRKSRKIHGGNISQCAERALDGRVAADVSECTIDGRRGNGVVAGFIEGLGEGLGGRSSGLGRLEMSQSRADDVVFSDLGLVADDERTELGNDSTRVAVLGGASKPLNDGMTEVGTNRFEEEEVVGNLSGEENRSTRTPGIPNTLELHERETVVSRGRGWALSMHVDGGSDIAGSSACGARVIMAHEEGLVASTASGMTHVALERTDFGARPTRFIRIITDATLVACPRINVCATILTALSFALVSLNFRRLHP